MDLHGVFCSFLIRVNIALDWESWLGSISPTVLICIIVFSIECRKFSLPRHWGFLPLGCQVRDTRGRGKFSSHSRREFLPDPLFCVHLLRSIIFWERNGSSALPKIGLLLLAMRRKRVALQNSAHIGCVMILEGWIGFHGLNEKFHFRCVTKHVGVCDRHSFNADLFQQRFNKGSKKSDFKLRGVNIEMERKWARMFVGR